MEGVAVVLEVQKDGDASVSQIHGKLIKADYHGLVIQERTQTSIVALDIVLDAYRADKQGKIVRRKVRYMIAQQVRQHLLDRHGLAFDLIKALSPSNAKKLHDNIDHFNLGHRHREREDQAEDD